ncbi:Poly(A) polymerase [Thraustotheca clavata]|uniref:Poly(A) polymerase n=1 Tax=Thraustotheca clavata TaxID=74557 RepID=A0A1W0AAC0_9STRA|nr:Poly(A) polymerase [Thraustotheca clavata]
MELEQAYKAIRTTPPEPADLELSAKLQAYMDEHYPMELDVNIQRRTIILGELRSIFRAWVKDVCLKRGLPEEIANEAGGIILVSGSYRLGVNEPGADIDTICVAPKFVTREDFFTSLKEILLKHAKVTNLVAIEGALVPILTFDYEEINIDLQIAILDRNSIPDNINVLDDQILSGVDPATEKSLNGPRVTELVIKLTPNRASFIAVLRIVRRWAKRRGLYSNKMGYLGGVNYCILVCFVNQLYPTAAPSTLLLRFFMILTNWKWPLAIQLCKTIDANLGLEVWNASNGTNKYQVMPILTPAYPSMNSSYSVSSHSLSVMKEEFKRGLEVVKTIIENGGTDWSPLFEPSPFFVDHQHYLIVEVFTYDEKDSAAWCGYVESRLRRLIESLAKHNPQLCRLRVHPKKYPLTFVGGEEKHGGTYFVAFDVDKLKLRNQKEVHLNVAVDDFKAKHLYGWQNYVGGMESKITPVTWKNLPEFVFEELGGRKPAKEMRQKLLKKKKEELAKLEETAAAKLLSPLKQRTTTTTPGNSQESTVGDEEPTSIPTEINNNGDVDSAAPTAPSTPASSPPLEEPSHVKRSLDEVMGNEAPSSIDVTPPPESIIPPTATSPPKRKKMKISFTK